jgi:hypothetical protein
MAKELGRRISEHSYGFEHELLGKPCFFDGNPAIPYGSYQVENRILLVVLTFRPDGRAYGMSGVSPDDRRLVVLDPSSRHAKEVYHLLLARLVDEFLPVLVG